MFCLERLQLSRDVLHEALVAYTWKRLLTTWLIAIRLNGRLVLVCATVYPYNEVRVRVGVGYVCVGWRNMLCVWSTLHT